MGNSADKIRAVEQRVARGLTLAFHALPRLVVLAAAGLALQDVLGCALTVLVANGLLAWTGWVHALALVRRTRWARLALVAPAIQGAIALVAALTFAALLIFPSAFVAFAPA